MLSNYQKLPRYISTFSPMGILKEFSNLFTIKEYSYITIFFRIENHNQDFFYRFR